METSALQDLLAQIKAKLERAEIAEQESTFYTVITLVFKPGAILTEEEEKELLALIKVLFQSQRQYVCCNRNWQEGPNFRAYLHVHEFSNEALFEQVIVHGLSVH